MFANNTSGIVTFYEKTAYQNFRFRACDGEGATFLFSGGGSLLPFQIKSSTDIGAVVSFKLKDEDDATLETLTAGLVVKTETTTPYFFYTYLAATEPANLSCGQNYYIDVVIGAQTFRSDLIQVIDVELTTVTEPTE